MTTIPTALATAIDLLQASFPGFIISVEAKEETKLLDPKQIIKNIVSELKATYTNLTVSIARNTYSAFAIIQVKSKPGTDDIAWFMNDSVGYIGESIYQDICKHIKTNAALTNAGMRVNDFIDGNRSASFEIYI